MCGIAGIVGGRVSRATIENMVAVQSHRGPDASSAYINTERGVALGHCRLSVLDLSDSSNQPMWSQDGRFVIVFNGEIYNYLELKEELSDYCFQSAGDTYFMLAA